MEVLKNYDNADTISINTIALEELLQEEREKEITDLNNLNKKVCYLHTSLLYYRNTKSKMGSICYDAWKTLVKKVGGTPNAWRDLGHSLGINQDDLDYIKNSVREDPVDVVLKVFMQNDNATLDKILDAFIKMQRYDILKAVEDPLAELSQCFNRDDSGYQSNSKNSGKREIISFTKNLVNDLPPALNKNFVLNRQKPPNKPVQSKLTLPDTKELKNDSPILFLTYAEDGFETAYNLKNYVYNWSEFPNTIVLTLDDRRNDVFQNPEKFIREYFEKAIFIIPILTTGYLNKINSYNASVPNTDDNLDFKYVNFIYNLIVNNYIYASGCLNKKVRSVLPQQPDINVLKNIAKYPDLIPWTPEVKFDEQFPVFLRTQYS